MTHDRRRFAAKLIATFAIAQVVLFLARPLERLARLAIAPVENGELTHPVSEVTISLNIDELLKRIDAVGSDLDLRTATAAPTIRVGRMTVAGAG